MSEVKVVFPSGTEGCCGGCVLTHTSCCAFTGDIPEHDRLFLGQLDNGSQGFGFRDNFLALIDIC